jgi:MoaA/NifB/PqqE/SkfB family radical SAM enzyme
MRRDFPDICAAFAGKGIKQTLLTNGLLLDKRLPEIEQYFSEIIVSIDGPNDEVHNGIRGIDSFGLIVKGVKKAIGLSGKRTVSVRTVIQKKNFRYIMDMVKFARLVGVSRISFLAADVFSDSFGRHARGLVASSKEIMLDEEETHEFRTIVERMSSECAEDFQTRLISESPEKLYHLVQYYEALIGKSPFPRNHCNAPMVSTVITSTGMLQPCFFLPPFANIRDGEIQSLLNRESIRSVRQQVRAYEPEQCKTCVCTLNMSPVRALLGRF